MGFFDNFCTDLNSMVLEGLREEQKRDGSRGFVILISDRFGSDWTFF